MTTSRLICTVCQSTAAPLDWRCAVCGAPLAIESAPSFNADAIDRGNWSMWRYAAILPVKHRFSLGEGMTPLVETSLDGLPFYAKLDYLNPSGSYKDRGISLMVNHILAHGVQQVVEDSSGNAGASMAMYATAAGVTARIFTPQSAPEGKKRQISYSGAEIVEVPGPRAATTDALMRALDQSSVVYATHAWSPFFVAGMMTIAWELWEQLGRAPGAVASPVGMGGLLLGVHRGFEALKAAGLINTLPRMFAVQAAACDPVVRAFEARENAPIPVQPSTTLADGIVVGKPVRGRELMQAIYESQGAAFRVSEEAIAATRAQMAKRGLFVEPTSAATATALPQIRAQYDGDLVLILTGNGLKVPA